MENKTEKDKSEYDNVTFCRSIKLLVGIVGQNVIRDFMPGNPESNERKLQRIYNGENVQYANLDISEFESESPQYYCKLFFEKIEAGYKFPQNIMASIIRDIEFLMHDFSIYTESNKILDKDKNEITLHALYGEVFPHIEERNAMKFVFKAPEKKVIDFLKDSYKIIFNDIFHEYNKKKKDFYKEVSKDICKQESIKQSIDNWINEKVFNPDWQTLIPVLDCLYKQKKVIFVHRLIKLYLRKNAQEVISDIFDISKNELEKVIIRLVEIIEGKQNLEKFPSELYFDDKWLKDLRIQITMCLMYQNKFENNSYIVKSNYFIKYLERNYKNTSEGKFLCIWLKTRANVFEKYRDLKSHKEEILDGYKKAFDELYNKLYTGTYLRQFLAEIIVINLFYRRSINNYYEYGYARKCFSQDYQKMLKIFKSFKNTDMRKTLTDLHENICELYITQRVFKIYDENIQEDIIPRFNKLVIFDVVSFRMLLE